MTKESKVDYKCVSLWAIWGLIIGYLLCLTDAHPAFWVIFRNDGSIAGVRTSGMDRKSAIGWLLWKFSGMRAIRAARWNGIGARVISQLRPSNYNCISRSALILNRPQADIP